MKARKHLLLCCIFSVLFYAAFAKPAPAEWVDPIKVNIKSRRQQDFQQMIEKYFESNGRLLMPLGFYSVDIRNRKTDEIRRLVRNGITFVHRYTNELTIERALVDIDHAVKAGVPWALNLPRAYIDYDQLWWENYLRDLVGQKQIVMWYLPEEPGAERLPGLKQLAGWLHKIDKSQRPVMTYLKSTDRRVLTEASEFMDCLVYGAYPTSWPPRLRIAWRMDWAYSCGAPAVMAIQEAYKTKSGWIKPEHIAFDIYLALIHGAKGLWWYNYDQVRHKPELLDAILAHTRILNGPEHLGEVFFKGEDNQNIRARIVVGPRVFPDSVSKSRKLYLHGKIYPSVHWRAYNHRGYTYLVMANGCEIVKKPHLEADERALTVKIEFQGFNGDSKIALLDGECEYYYQSGILTVTLKPLGAAVFQVTP